MPVDHVPSYERAFIGRACSVKRQDHGWAFFFGEDASLGVSVPWRIVTADGIAFADTDDKQLFGLPQPVDGEARSNELLRGRSVISFKVDVKTADLRIDFDGEVHLEMFNNSSGYEGWNATIKFADKGMSVIGLGGGDIAIFRT